MFDFRPHAATHSMENQKIYDGNQILKTQLTEFVLSDAQSFRVVENPHFRQVIETAVELGYASF